MLMYFIGNKFVIFSCILVTRVNIAFLNSVLIQTHIVKHELLRYYCTRGKSVHTSNVFIQKYMTKVKHRNKVIIDLDI